MNVRWTMPAVNQLESIFEYIADANPAASERTIRRIHDAIRRTARLPYARRAGRVPVTREIAVAATPYVVAYLIAEKSIHVLAILHGSQDWPQAF